MIVRMGEMMDATKMKTLAIGLLACYLTYKYGKIDALKAAALGVGGTIVARQIPYVKDALAA